MKLNTITRFLNKELKVGSIKDESRNGLQVRSDKEITKIGFAVDACMETFQKAKDLGCNLLIVHHGPLWKKQKYKKATQNRIKYLKKSKISLYAAHLPLDLHKDYGNNAQICKVLDITRLTRFGYHHGFPLGYKGTVQRQTINRFTRLVEKMLQTRCKILKLGPKYIRTIGVSSGGGGFALEEAMGKLDAFLVGEISHSAFHHAKESKLNVIIAGHYKTETLGVKALAKLVHERFNIQTVFIDNPTGL
ncbi:MAG: Nif3-like dinuclear metal center hexameric protein [Candidatus Woesearchaeota archaeon]